MARGRLAAPLWPQIVSEKRSSGPSGKRAVVFERKTKSSPKSPPSNGKRRRAKPQSQSR